MHGMDDKRLDELLDDAARSYRVPPEPPVDDIWADIAAEGFPAASRWTQPGWRTVAIAASAALLIGVAGGRFLLVAGPPLLP